MANERVPEITIHLAEERDIARLAALLAPEVSVEQVRLRWQEHQAGYGPMLVAEVDGQAVGTVSIEESRYHLPDSLRLFALAVGAAFRGRGIGTSLIEAVEEEASRRGLQTVHLEVAADNADAIRLYEGLGYQRQGDPRVHRWWRVANDGSGEQVEQLSLVMLKRL